jgi:hypothetical protein
LHFVWSRGLDLFVRASLRCYGLLLLAAQAAEHEHAQHRDTNQQNRAGSPLADSWRLLWLRAQIDAAWRKRLANRFGCRPSPALVFRKVILGGHD